jgi:hypothetical protein
MDLVLDIVLNFFVLSWCFWGAQGMYNMDLATANPAWVALHMMGWLLAIRVYVSNPFTKMFNAWNAKR